VIDDTNLPGIGRACDFLSTNRPDFEELRAPSRSGFLRGLFRDALPPPPPLLRLFLRVNDEDPRDWDHFVPF
jgi:hypothetical protein